MDSIHSEAGLLGFKYWFRQLLVNVISASYLTSLCPALLICNMETTEVLSFWSSFGAKCANLCKVLYQHLASPRYDIHVSYCLFILSPFTKRQLCGRHWSGQLALVWAATRALNLKVNANLEEVTVG